MGKNDLVKKLRDSGRKDYVRLADSIEKDLDYYHDLTRDDLKQYIRIIVRHFIVYRMVEFRVGIAYSC